MKKHLIVIFIIALAARLVYLFLLSPGRSVHIDEWIYYETVEHWLAGQDLKSIYHPPVYPLMIFGVFKIFGVSLVALQLIQILMGALTAVLTALIGREISNDKIGLIAGLVYAVSIRPVWMPSEIMSETLFTFLLILAVWVFIKALKGLAPQRAQRPRSDREVSAKRTQGDSCHPECNEGSCNNRDSSASPQNDAFVSFVVNNGSYFLLVVSGLLFGLTALTRSVALGLPFLLAVYFLVRSFRYSVISFFSSSVLVVIFLLAFSLPLIPWVIRTHRVTGRFMPGSASYGVTFFWHNTEMMWEPGTDYLAEPIKLSDFKNYSGVRGRPLPDAARHPLIKQMHQIARGYPQPIENADRMMGYTMDYLVNLGFLQLAGLEIVKLYRLVLPYHPYYNPFPDLTFMITLIFFCVFLYYFFRRGIPDGFMNRGIMALLALLGYLALTTFVFGGMPRYRDPYDPYIIILAAIGAAGLFRTVPKGAADNRAAPGNK